ncbi:MAG: glyoxalase/bleomycin resistance/dioxygenase family protein [Treponema sp.]|jgi:catechol 2,3-dioxygenase-like lactoylglutathione lyase family enzyme|nr:glyoxalase/bleomycin resistance/dioxygenase family protein [Treponema sp.]
MIKYGCTLIAVKDMVASRKFYEDLFGLKVTLDLGLNIAFDCGLALQAEFTNLMGISSDTISFEKTNNFELYFEEENLDEFLNHLNNYGKIEYVHPVKKYPWGQRVIRFYDLDNHIIEVGESMCSVIRHFLEEGLTVEETAKRTQHPIDFVKGCIDNNNI